MRKNSDARLPIDYLLKDESKFLARGAEMLECGESGDCCSLNKSKVPELSTKFTPRDSTIHYVATKEKYRY